MHGRRRHDEVADARQSAERVLRAAHFQPQTADFGNAARDEGGAGVVAVAQPAGNADGERLDVLHRAAQLYAKHVRVRIGAHTGVHEHILHRFRHLHVRAGGYDGSRHVKRDFLRMGRAGQRDKLHMVMLTVLAQFVADDLGHGHECVRLNALGNIHDNLSVRDERARAFRRLPNGDRRHGKKQNILAACHCLQIAGEMHRFRNHQPRQRGMRARSRQIFDFLREF